MGKYLDKTGLQYFYNKLKDKFADKSALDSLTGAMQWKGKLSALPTDLSTYSAGNVISVDNKEYVCTEVDGVKSWIELGDEGSYLLKTAAEETYLKKAAGEVKTENLADGAVTKSKLSTGVQTSLGKADTALQSVPRATLTSDGTVRADPLGVPLKDLANSQTTYGGVKVAMGSDGVLGVGWGSKDYFGVVKVSDGLKATNGVVSVDTDTIANKAYVDSKAGSAVQYTTQTLTDEQKEQARNNIGADGCLVIDLGDSEIADVWDDTFTQENFCARSSDILTDAYKEKRLKVLAFIKSKIPQSEFINAYKYIYNPLPAVFLVHISDSDTGTTGVIPFRGEVSNDGGDNLYVCTFLPLYEFQSGIDSEARLRNLNEVYSMMPYNVGGDSEGGAITYGFYEFSTGNVVYTNVPGAVLFENTKPLYLQSEVVQSLTYTDEDKATGREILNVPDKSTLATSLQAITIYTDNTAEHKTANLANIKAYEDNLKNLGVDVTKYHIIPVIEKDGVSKGFLNGNTSSNRYQGMMGQDNQWKMCVVASDGTFVDNPVLGGDISQLNTTAKTSTISAINEVNTLATRKATLTQDGVVRVELRDANSNYSQLQSSVYPKLKVARDVNGVLAVGTAKDKNTYGVVKIGDGLNVTTAGVVSVSNATQSANGLMSAEDKKKLDNTLQLGEENVGSDTYTTLKNSYLNLIAENSADYENGSLRLAGNALEFFDSSNNRTVLKGINSKTIAVGDYDSSGTSVSGGTLTGLATPINDSDAATKAYVDSKITGGTNSKIVLLYDDDDTGGTTTSLTGVQYKLITDAISVNRTPDIELVMYTGGEYYRHALGYFFDNELYFISAYPGDDLGGTYIRGVKATISYTASDDGTYSVSYEIYGGTTLNSFLREYMKSYADTEVVTGGSKSLSVYGTRNFIWTMGINLGEGFVTFTLPNASAAYDGLTYTFTKIGGTAVTGSLNLTSSSTNIKDIKNSDAVKTMSVAGSTLMKLTAVYSSTGKCWYVYKQSIE